MWQQHSAPLRGSAVNQRVTQQWANDKPITALPSRVGGVWVPAWISAIEKNRVPHQVTGPSAYSPSHNNGREEKRGRRRQQKTECRSVQMNHPAATRESWMTRDLWHAFFSPPFYSYCGCNTNQMTKGQFRFFLVTPKASTLKIKLKPTNLCNTELQVLTHEAQVMNVPLRLPASGQIGMHICITNNMHI